MVSINNGVGGGLPASGTVDIPQPQTTTTYTLTVVGCGQTRQVQITVFVTSCPIPVISSFTVNPNSVLIGGNQTITFNWNVGGSVDTLSIDNGIGTVSGNSIAITQPQVTTTYTLTTVGCGQTRMASVTVTASNVPPPRVITQSRELAQNGGIFSCRTANIFRISIGFPPIPCTNWTVDLTVTVTEEASGTYLITASKISNADTSPDLRGRGFAPEIGLFGAVNIVPCNGFILPFCYEDRDLLGFWTPYGGGTSNFGGIVAVDYNGANTTATWRLTRIPADAEKIVFRSSGGGSDQYIIYFTGFNLGPGDNQSAGDYNYDYVNNCCGGGGEL